MDKQIILRKAVLIIYDKGNNLEFHIVKPRRNIYQGDTAMQHQVDTWIEIVPAYYLTPLPTSTKSQASR